MTRENKLPNNIDVFNTNQEMTWCPGCGGYGFLTALKKALVKAKKEPKDVVVTYDIGFSANADFATERFVPFLLSVVFLAGFLVRK